MMWIRTARGTLAKRYGPARSAPARSSFPTPQVISDGLEDRRGQAVQSMADGKYYGSKSALRRSYRRSGNPQGVEYNEVGNEVQPLPRSEPDMKGIEAAVDRALAQASA